MASSGRSMVDDDADDSRRRGRWRRRLFWGAILLAGVVLAAPTLTATTPLRNWVLGLATARLNGTARCGDASWGWFTGTSVGNLEILDAQGQVVVQCERVEVDRTLGQLAVNLTDLGTIHVHRPKLTVVATQSSTNLEDLLKQVIERPLDRLRAKPAVRVEIVEGSATIVDRVTTQEWQLAELSGEVAVDPAARTSTTIKLSAGIRGSTGAGRIGVNLALPGGGGEPREALIDLGLTTERFPLAPVAAIVRRFDPRFHAAGLLTGNAAIRWPAVGDWPQLAISGNVSAEQLSLGGAFLGDDRLQLARVSAPVELRWDGRLLDVRQCQITSDVGKVTVRGTAPLDSFDWPGLVKAIAQASAEVSATVDIPQLAAALPRTLQVRPDTRLTGGQVQLALSHREQPGRVITTGSAEVTQLSAVAAGRNIVWEEPLSFRFSANTTSQGMTVENLTCNSSFLQAQGAGTRRQAAGSVQFDLRRLAMELQKFFDLRGLQLAGTGSGKFDWQQDDEGGFGLYSQLDVSQFQLAAPQWKAWEEPAARVTLNATGQIEKQRLRAVYSAGAKIEAARDRLHLQLAKPVFDPNAATSWPFKASLRGDLAGWQSRLRAFVSPEGWELGGFGDLTASVSYSAERLHCEQLALTAQPFRLKYGRLQIEEPKLTATATTTIDAAARRVAVKQASLTSESVALTSDALMVEWTSGDAARPVQLAASGAVAFRGDVERLHRWTLPAGTTPATWYGGRLGGQAEFSHAAGRMQTQLHVEIENLRVLEAARVGTAVTPLGVSTAAPRVTWSERLVKIDATAAADYAGGVVQLERLDVASSAVSLSAAGRVSDLRAACRVDLAGNFDYDLAEVTQLLRPYFGENVQLAGRGPHRFVVRGPLASLGVAKDVSPQRASPRGASVSAVAWSKELTGEAAFGWSAARLFGLDVGAATVQAKLSSGILAVTPLDLRVNEGRLSLAPQVRLDCDPAVLVLRQGPVLTDIRLTPEMCAAGLKYVHPLLAGATSVDGRISLDIQGATVPLADFQKLNTAGRLKIQTVTVSPGPILTAIVPLLAVVAPQKAPLAPEVDFWVQNARVYHRGAGIQLGKTWLTTSGSIGFDESLDLVAELPIPEEWLKTPALATAFRNQKLRIPIQGTLQKPRVDPRQLDQIRRQLLGEAAGNLLLDQLERALRPRPKP